MTECKCKWPNSGQWSFPAQLLQNWSLSCLSISFYVWTFLLSRCTQGLVSNLTLASQELRDWEVFSLSIDEAITEGLLWEGNPSLPFRSSILSPPAFYTGSFIIPDGIPDLPQDTYILFPGWKKVGTLHASHCFVCLGTFTWIVRDSLHYSE